MLTSGGGLLKLGAEMTTKKNQANKEHRDYWSDCGQVFFTGGVGHGLTPELKTIPLGYEADIHEAFRTGKLPDYLKPVQHEVLVEILEYRMEVLGSARGVEVKRPSAVRSRPSGAVKRRAARIRHAAKRKRITIH